MEHDLATLLEHASDEAVLAGAQRLAASHHRNGADLVAHVAVVDARGLFLPTYTSLFKYCCGALRLSEGTTANLIETARAARRFPLILGLLRDGSINPTTVRVLSTSLTAENHADVLREAAGKTKLDVQAIAARLRPSPDVSTSLRRIPSSPAPAPALFDRPESETPVDVVGVAPCSPPVVAAPPGRAAVVPLSPARYSYKLTIDDEMRRLLLQARELTSHAVAAGDDLTVLKRALEVFVEKQLRKRFGLTTRRGRKAKATKPGSRHIPAAVARAVYERDGGACSFMGADGVRCGERQLLQLHHRKPWAVGGKPTAENIGLLCQRHNQHEAKVYFERPDLALAMATESARSR